MCPVQPGPMTQPATQTAEAKLSIDVECDKCKRKRGEPDPAAPSSGGQTKKRPALVSVFLEMDPRVGAEPADPRRAGYVPVFRCLACWLDYDGFDGVRPHRLLEAEPAAIAIAPPVEPAKVTRKRGKRSQG